VFCASVNEDCFLIDPTGNSRFWTLPLVKIDYQHDIDMQQVFAQLYEEFKKGATWWLTPVEDARLDELNKNHNSVSVIAERVSLALDNDLPEDKWTNKTATEVLEIAGIQNPTNSQARECGTFLRQQFGPPKKIRGIMKWKVPIDAKTISYR
jgi:putative DNA primase/helicase